MDKKVMDIRLKSWIPIIEAQVRSGLSKKDFCQQNNICRGTFYKWQGILRERVSEGWDPKTSDLPVTDCQYNESKDEDDQHKFFEISTSSHSIPETDHIDDVYHAASFNAAPKDDAIRISYGGFSVTLSGRVDESSLTSILRAVKHA